VDYSDGASPADAMTCEYGESISIEILSFMNSFRVVGSTKLPHIHYGDVQDGRPSSDDQSIVYSPVDLDNQSIDSTFLSPFECKQGTMLLWSGQRTHSTYLIKKDQTVNGVF